MQVNVDISSKLMELGIKDAVLHNLQQLYKEQAVERVHADPFLALREARGSYA